MGMRDRAEGESRWFEDMGNRWEDGTILRWNTGEKLVGGSKEAWRIILPLKPRLCNSPLTLSYFSIVHRWYFWLHTCSLLLTFSLTRHTGSTGPGM